MKAVNGKVDMRIWYGMKAMPFAQDVREDDMFLRPCMEEITDRVAFTVQNSMFFAVTGDVGAGKSTSMRYALSKLPKRQYQVIPMIGGSWSFVELLRSCLQGMGMETRSFQKASMLKQIADAYSCIRESGVTPVLFIDEAQLFQKDVFRQLHLLSVPDPKCRKVVPMVLCGQEDLIDNLSDPFCKPLLSRIMDGCCIHAMGVDEFRQYMFHQTNVIGNVDGIFDETALTVLHQVTAGLPRRVNEIALLSMKKAMDRESREVSSDIIRQVSKEWWAR